MDMLQMTILFMGVGFSTVTPLAVSVSGDGCKLRFLS